MLTIIPTGLGRDVDDFGVEALVAVTDGEVTRSSPPLQASRDLLRH
jgi:hypothetical protein